MRVALINQPWSVSPPDDSADSIALVNFQLLQRLSRTCEVRSYGRLLPGRPAVEKIDGVEYRRVSAHMDRYTKGLRLLDKWQLMPKGRPFHQSPLYHRGYALAVARDLRISPCDIVHVHNFAQCARIVRKQNPSACIVLHMHCDWLKQLDRTLVERSLESVNLVLGVSQFITDRARERFPDSHVGFHTLYNGVDFDRFACNSPENKPKQRILFVGRLSPEKGVHVLIQAFVQIARDFPDATLHLIGPDNVLSREFVDPNREDPELERLSTFFQSKEGYAAHLRALVPGEFSDRVHFLGTLPHDQLPDHYRAASLLVVPSVFDEPFGLPLVEAMAAGLPCVATSSGAFPEIVEDGVTGLLIPRGKVTSLASVLATLLADPQRCAQMGYAGRQRAAALFSWDKNAKTLADYYREALPAPPKTNRVMS
jgi:glycosyltransferase involved in cell wall biosynthesis